MPQQSDESLRAFLDRREKQLTEDIAARHSELAPMEAELAEVRRAKGALGIPQVVQLSARSGSMAMAGGGGALSDSPLPLRSQEQAAHDAVVQIVTERHRQTAAVTGVLTLKESADHFSGHGVVSPSPYEYLTMKQLIMKALTGHFMSGATAKQLREFFRDAWARDIDRESLSPQLSRLRNDKIIDRDGNVWFLVKTNEAPPSDDPDSAPESPDVGK
jgi:hypothetical protein